MEVVRNRNATTGFGIENAHRPHICVGFLMTYDGGSMMNRILLIEDEAKIAEVIRSYLENEGYEVEDARTGEQGIRMHQTRPFDLILLDLMLPGMSGEDVCKQLRTESRVSIVMLTAKTSETSKVLGLNLGADDSITKPFSPKELVARVAAVLRRSATEELLAEKLFLPHGIVLDNSLKEIFKHEEKVNVTPAEYKILLTLSQHPKRTFTRSELIEKAICYKNVYKHDSKVVLIK